MIKIKLSDEIHWETEELIKDGTSNIGLYHSKNPLGINKKNVIYSQDFYLLYYYHNKLVNFGLKLEKSK